MSDCDLTLIGKSWKTHPENFSKCFPGHDPERITGKLIHLNIRSTYSVLVKRPD